MLEKYDFGGVSVTINRVSIDAPTRWLNRGGRDFLEVPLYSMMFGTLFFLSGQGIVGVLLSLDDLYLAVWSLAGFILVAPLFCWGLYGVSMVLESGKDPVFGGLLRLPWQRMRGLAGIIVVVLVHYLCWLQTGLLLFGLFLGGVDASIWHAVPDSPRFLALALCGAVLGTLYGLSLYSLCVVAIPCQYLLGLSSLDAMRLSVCCVWLNWKVMLSWAILIGFTTLLSLLPGLAGLVVAMPVLGYASWHAFRDLTTVTVIKSAVQAA